MTSQQTSSSLYVIGVPIGNIGDLSYRAFETLSRLKFIFCEDRRQTQELFKRAKIPNQPQMICLNEHKEHLGEKWLTQFQKEGQDVGFVTDAGTPSVSDPGNIVVRLAHSMGIDVIPVPGPSALSTFISIIGAPSMPIHFIGFLPKKAQHKKEVFLQNPSQDRLLIFFESPHRLRETLEILRETVDDYPIYLAREMTKTYQDIQIIDQDKLSQPFSDWLVEKGECVLGVVQRRKESQTWQIAADDLKESLGIKQTSLFIQKHFEVPKNTVYSYLLAQK